VKAIAVPNRLRQHGTRHSGPATIRLVNLDLPALAA
jgi:hypothetical protein